MNTSTKQTENLAECGNKSKPLLGNVYPLVINSKFIVYNIGKPSEFSIPRTEITIGSIISIDRWDGNGISDEVKVIRIISGTTRAIIKTNKGYFMFSKWNSMKDDIDFIWTCKGKKWQKKYMKWIDGNRYFLNVA